MLIIVFKSIFISLHYICIWKNKLKNFQFQKFTSLFLKIIKTEKKLLKKIDFTKKDIFNINRSKINLQKILKITSLKK